MHSAKYKYSRNYIKQNQCRCKVQSEPVQEIVYSNAEGAAAAAATEV